VATIDTTDDAPVSAPGDDIDDIAPPPLVEPVRAGIIGGLFLGLILVLPLVVSNYWLQIMVSVVIYSIVTMGLGLLIGRVGMVSLCQIPLFAIGAWVALRFSYLSETIPFPVLLLLAGVITGVIGVLIGLPALRLSGLYLALITLMAAGAVTVFLARSQFPNGGSGFFANDRAGGSSSRLARPDLATGDTAYYRYCVVVAALMFLLAFVHVKGKPGRAWAAVRQSEVTAAAAGVNTTLYKLWAFALASFVTGVAGGLLAAASGGVTINQFPIQNTILLLAVVLMGGVYRLGGAVVAALLLRFLPAVLDSWGVSTELLTILFGIGILQVILTAPAGLIEQVPKDLSNLGRKLGGLVAGAGPPAERGGTAT
jgi:branched-chain amino acid transport system permease protein